MEDRYYTKAEYDALSADAKKELAAKRLKRGHKAGAKDSKISKATKYNKGKTNADVIKALKAVQRNVSQLTKQTAADDGSTHSDEASTDDLPEGNSPSKVVKFGHQTKEQLRNRTHAALTRLKQKRDAASK